LEISNICFIFGQKLRDMEETHNAEKRLVDVIINQKTLAEERDKLILEIHNILDRIIVDRPVALNNKDAKCGSNPMVKQTFIADITDITGDMRTANESLRQAVQRLNDLI